MPEDEDRIPLDNASDVLPEFATEEELDYDFDLIFWEWDGDEEYEND
jgi:hypothetical protein